MSKIKPGVLLSSLVAAGLGLGMAAGSVAVAKGGSHHGHFDRGAMLAEKLDLSDDQRASVDAIFERNRPAMKALRQKSRANRKALRDLNPTDPQFSNQVQGLADEAGVLARDRVLNRAQIRAELATVLSAEQMAEMKALKEKRGPHRGKRGADRSSSQRL